MASQPLCLTDTYNAYRCSGCPREDKTRQDHYTQPAWLIGSTTPHQGQPSAVFSCLHLRVVQPFGNLQQSLLPHELLHHLMCLENIYLEHKYMENSHSDLPLLHTHQVQLISKTSATILADPLTSRYARLAANVLWQPMKSRTKPNKRCIAA